MGLLTFDTRHRDLSKIRFYLSQQEDGNPASLFSSDVMQTCRMKDGRIYVATLGGGLQVIESKNLLQSNLTFRAIDTQTIQTINSLVPDNADNLWVIGESRIARLPHDGSSLEEFGADELGEVNITEARPSHNPQTDRIVLATEGGFLSFLPKQMKKSMFQPSIVFTAVNYQDNLGMQPLLNIERLNLSVEHRTLTIYFSALDFVSSDDIRYAYRLDDSKQWIYTRPGINSVSFTDFPAGNHTLYVRSTNSDGVWVENTRELHVYATPTFFESWYGRLIMSVIVIVLLAFAAWHYLRRKRVEIHEEAVEQADAGKVRFLLQTPDIIDEEKQLMDRLLSFIEEHLSDPDLKVDDMAAGVNLGRSAFYSRIKKVADMTPNDFLRHVRMQRAEELVTKSQLTFSQIAYQVGFTDPKYFGKCFKKHTGMSPSEYRTEAVKPEQETGNNE